MVLLAGHAGQLFAMGLFSRALSWHCARDTAVPAHGCFCFQTLCLTPHHSFILLAANLILGFKASAFAASSTTIYL